MIEANYGADSMSRLNPDKLTVEYRGAVSQTEPIHPRRYTLTHSDTTAELFLTIAPDFAYDQLNETRDEVLGEWILTELGYRYDVYLQAVLPGGEGNAELRREIFRRELPLALEAIRYGDREFFEAHPGSDQVPILVYYFYPGYGEAEYWGTFSEYDITAK